MTGGRSSASCDTCGRSTVEPPFHHPDCAEGRSRALDVCRCKHHAKSHLPVGDGPCWGVLTGECRCRAFAATTAAARTTP